VVQRLANPKAEVPAEALAVLADTLLPPDRRKTLTDGTIKRLIVVPDGPLTHFGPPSHLVPRFGRRSRADVSGWRIGAFLGLSGGPMRG